MVKSFFIFLFIPIFFLSSVLVGCNQKHGKFTKINDMNIARSAHSATLLKNGKVFITGGGSKIAEIYDPKSGKFHLSAKSKINHYNHEQFLIPDGRVVIIDSRGIEIFDPKTSKFSFMGNLNILKGYKPFTATLLENGNILITGKNKKAGIFNPVTGKFKYTGEMARKRVRASSVKLDKNKILIVGGDSDLEGTVEVYDIQIGKFSSISKLKTSRNEPVVTLLNNGKVLISGGYTLEPYKEIKTAEIYDPSKNKSIFEINMNKARGPRGWFKGILLNNGNVLFVGDEYGKDVELFDVKANKFINIGNTASFRGIGSELTLLSNDKVLITGGRKKYTIENEQPLPVKSAEIYEFKSN